MACVVNDKLGFVCTEDEVKLIRLLYDLSN